MRMERRRIGAKSYGALWVIIGASASTLSEMGGTEGF